MGKNCVLIIKFLLFCKKNYYIYELKSKNL